MNAAQPVTGGLGFSKTGLALIPRLVRLVDRERTIVKFEARARGARASQIGGNHVVEVILEQRYYLKYGEGMQGGSDTGPTDPPRDRDAEMEYALREQFVPLTDPAVRGK